MKSMISRMVIFLQEIWLSTPNPREEGIPRINAPIATPTQVVRRFRWNLSIKIETIVSINEIEEVNAANNTSRKKTNPIRFPAFMLSNTFGSVTNIKLGPAFKLEVSPFENANTAGIIINPAKNAIPVSKISI